MVTVAAGRGNAKALVGCWLRGAMLVTNVALMTELVTNTGAQPMSPRAAATFERLRAVALDLFTTQGFAETTVEQIAAAAGVSHMTFFRYFPTKESVIVEDPYDPLIADAVRAQPTDLRPLERVRRGVLAAWTGAPIEVDAETRARIALMARHASLRAKAWENTRETERVVAEALVEAGTSPREAAVAAGAVMGAVMAALLDWATSDDDAGLGAAIVGALTLLAPDDEAVR